MVKFRLGISFILILLTVALVLSIHLNPYATVENIEEKSITNSSTLSEEQPSLTWISKTQNESIPVNNSSSIVGDHVLLNAIFPEILNVTYCEMRIWNASVNVNVTISSYASTITIDTYYLYHKNQTYSIQVIGNSSDNDTWIFYRQDVEICNFFKPHVIVPSPVALSIDLRTYNITWSCTDSNQDEVHIYSVWISSNDGVSFMLLAPNVTRTWIVWDSTGWLDDDYLFRVRAHSIDLTYPGLDLSDPPTGYLPGDFSDGFSPSFEGTGPPPVTTTDATTITDGSTTTSNTNGIPLDYILVFIINGFALTIVIVLAVLLLKRKG